VSDEEVCVVGGPIDGTIATINADCSRRGFFVHCLFEGTPREVWYGYFDQGSKDPQGRRIFSPGKPKPPQPP
jgi:hypothetical protein